MSTVVLADMLHIVALATVPHVPRNGALPPKHRYVCYWTSSYVPQHSYPLRCVPNCFCQCMLSSGPLETHITLLDLYTRLQGDYPVVSAVANMVVRWKDMSEWKDAAQV